MKMKKNKENESYIKRMSDPPIKETKPKKAAKAYCTGIVMAGIPIYSMDYQSPIEYVPRFKSVNVKFWCPACTTKFDVDIFHFKITDSMVCFCGTTLEFDGPLEYFQGQYIQDVLLK
jgi:hypothetical protein